MDTPSTSSCRGLTAAGREQASAVERHAVRLGVERYHHGVELSQVGVAEGTARSRRAKAPASRGVGAYYARAGAYRAASSTNLERASDQR
jgi:hypothetical protein